MNVGFTGPSHVSGKTSNVEFLFEEQSLADTPDEAGAPHLGYQPLLPEEKKTFVTEEDGPSFSDAKSLQTVSKQETPGSTSDTGLSCPVTWIITNAPFNPKSAKGQKVPN